jgi:phage gp45-like
MKRQQSEKPRRGWLRLLLGVLGTGVGISITINIDSCRSTTINEGDTNIFNEGDTNIFNEGDTNIFNEGDTNIFNEGDTNIFNEGDTNIFNEGDTNIFNEGDTSIFNEGDTSIFNEGDTSIFNEGDTSIFNEGDTSIFNGGDVFNPVFQVDNSWQYQLSLVINFGDVKGGDIFKADDGDTDSAQDGEPPATPSWLFDEDEKTQDDGQVNHPMSLLEEPQKRFLQLPDSEGNNVEATPEPGSLYGVAGIAGILLIFRR